MNEINIISRSSSAVIQAYQLIFSGLDSMWLKISIFAVGMKKLIPEIKLNFKISCMSLKCFLYLKRTNFSSIN